MAIIKAREVTPNRSHTGEVNVKKMATTNTTRNPLKGTKSTK
jgi:hypothetical protein